MENTKSFYIGTTTVTAEHFNMNGQDGYNVTDEHGNKSWSPQDVFEADYRPSGKFDFGHALTLIKSGHRLSRKGWNGARQYVFLVKGSRFTVNRPPLSDIYPEGHEINYRAHIDISLDDGNVATWSPSNSDALAEDWFLVE